jgi:hypothetical protein
MLQDLRRLLGAYATRLQAFVAATPPGSLQVTGVLGLAALLFAYYHLRRPSAPPPSNRAARSAAGTAGPRLGSGGAAAAGSSLGAAAAAAKAGGSGRQQQELAATTPLGRAVRVKLSGVGKVTISSLGTLAEEGASTELQEGVSLQPSALAVLREVAACTDTYIITQVWVAVGGCGCGAQRGRGAAAAAAPCASRRLPLQTPTQVQDDIGQAVMLGALEAAGLLGRGPGQVRASRVNEHPRPKRALSTIRVWDPPQPLTPVLLLLPTLHTTPARRCGRTTCSSAPRSTARCPSCASWSPTCT